MKKLFVILGLFAAVGCFGPKKTVDEASTLLESGSTVFADLTQEQLDQGMMLYNKNCTHCHALKSPEDYTQEHWDKVLPNMVKMAVEKKGMVISETDQNMIYRYVISVMLDKTE